MSKRLTTEEFIKKAIEIHGNKYDYSKVDCLNRDEKGRVCIICKTHGEFLQQPYDHLRGRGCPKCVIDKFKKQYSKTCENFINEAKTIHGDKYDYSKVKYVNAKTKVCIICKKHGSFWQTPDNHLQGKGCPTCANKNVDTKEFIKKANKVHHNKYDYSNVVYTKNTTKVLIVCPEHGKFWQTPMDHLEGKGCYLCDIKTQTEKRSMSTEEFISRVSLIHNGKYGYDNVNYINANINVEINCPKHGSFWQQPYSHLQGCGCPKCADSKAEIEIYDFICALIGKENVISRDKKLLGKLEVDILVPHLKVGFEYDGLHWHSEECGKNKHYHLDKTLECENKGVHLIHIFEDEWLEHEDLVKDKICHMLHKDSEKIKIGARKCTIKEIDVMYAKPFLEKYHIQGWASSSIYCGAYFEDELVGVMSFLQESKGMWNLTRFSTNINYAIPGLANKVFKFFVTNHEEEVNEVKTFLDRRWSWADVNVYDRMNFTMTNIVKPNYHYIKGQKRYHKFGFRKQALSKKYGFPIKMTESEMVKKIGMEKIWDCGLYKYVWKNPLYNKL